MQIHKLSALRAQKLSKSGWYADGQGLYLQVSLSGTKSWVYRYKKAGKERRHGLGSYPTITLEAARKAAEFCRQLRTDGHDPIDYKKDIETKRQLEAAKKVTFKECAIAYINAHQAGWKNRKHEQQWRNSLATYAYPIIGHLSVQDIEVNLVMNVLEPIWYTKTETASRVRQRIENIIDWAKVRKYRTGENPARWRGHLDKLLPKPTKVQKVKHFPAMPYDDLPEYFQRLRMKETIAAKALAFNILTATRSNETREAKWNEIDLETAIWTIPAERMKADKEHRVPLTPECLALLNEVKPFNVDDLVFPGSYKKNKKRKGITDAALLKHLQKTHPALTAHGFRSSFRDWCAEKTNFPSELAESALAHTIKDATQAAYERGDKFDKRRKLMSAWDLFCIKGSKSSDVIPINRKSVAGT